MRYLLLTVLLPCAWKLPASMRYLGDLRHRNAVFRLLTTYHCLTLEAFEV